MANPRKKLMPPGIGRTIDAISRLDERGVLYYLDYGANYYQLEKYIDLMSKPGCSTFLTDSLGGDKLFCRNYDFTHYRYNRKGGQEDITGLIILVHCTNPRAKYKSLGTVDGFWLDAEKGRYFEGSLTDGKTDITRIAMAPYAIMDGINEKGLAVSIMHLPTENRWQEIDYTPYESLTDTAKAIALVLDTPGERPPRLDPKVKKDAIAINTADRLSWRVNKNLSVNQSVPGRKKMIHPVLMRKMLDFAASVDEAIEIARSVNVVSAMPDNDYHIMVSDRSGRSVMLEWVDNELRVKDTAHGTNFYLTREDRYGYGYERDGILAACLDKYKNGMSEEIAMRTLQLASQNSPEGSDVGFTQWSGVYNLNRGTLRLSVFLDYDRTYEFKI